MMKPTDRNKQLYRDMQEEPDKYSDQELEAVMDELDQMPDVAEAWLEFEREKMAVKREKMAVVHSNGQFRKVAAMLIGILTISGLAIAAIHIARQAQQPLQRREMPAVTASPKPSTVNCQLSTQSDSTALPRLYDNVPLGEILSNLSAYYQVKVIYRTEDARKLRLFYNWKPEYSLQKVVEMLNNFEWLQLELENDTLFVKSTAIPAHDC